ncbi:hypothetical protein [Amycolatopsis sp. 195334CR]|nr:hypothetical protein [Amycolatopsis sp. 195334CR]
MNSVLRLQNQENPEEVEADAPISTYSLTQCGNSQLEPSVG